jgi:hypothetical protein
MSRVSQTLDKQLDSPAAKVQALELLGKLNLSAQGKATIDGYITKTFDSHIALDD